MNDLINYIKSVIDRFGCNVMVQVIFNTADDECPVHGKQNDEILDAGELEN